MIYLLDFFVHGVLAQNRIVLLQLHTAGSRSAVFGRNITGGTGLFGALQNYLNAVTF